ncbi:hypothetical protein MRS44_005632 [Fusarium solani]|uniref:uncharacterized protein n=1 Tax=Fusarium solani TaxID=169388 RepID=UPI0032C47B6E|nr:hypothetical protein MRS44_005632 [Fusarium solani]
MIPRASLLLALSLVCIESAIAGPCKPGTTLTALTSSSETESATSHAASSTTVVTTDSTTSGPGTDSTTASLTLTESSTESTTFVSTTSSVSVSSDSITLSTSEATTSLSMQTSTTSTAHRPDSTAFNIIPGDGSAASGFLKVRTLLGADIYFNNPYTTYQTGVFVVTGLNQLVERGSQRICAYFRTGQGYGDLIGCQPEVDPDLREVPLTCQLTASEKIQCSVPGKFCYYQNDMLHCEDRGTFSSLYIEPLSGAGYGVIIGPSGLSRSPVELAAAPIETQ